MRTLLTTIATLAVALICWMAPTESSAQPADICKPDCDSLEWSNEQTIVITVGSGCIVRVKYAVRSNCSGFNDLGILSVETVSGCPGGLYSPAQILKLVSEEMFLLNPMGFPEPVNGSCVPLQRVIKGACWTVELDCEMDSIYVPCDSVACCVTFVAVCRDLEGNKFVDFQSSYVTEPCDTNMFWCEPVCEEETLTSPPGGSPELGIVPVQRGSDDTPIRSRPPQGEAVGLSGSRD